MALITVKGEPVKTVGDLPMVGETAPDFRLTKTDLTDISEKDFKGKTVVLNIFPSIDTPVCSASVRRFNQDISRFPNAVVICVSMDLPFAHARFCEAEGLEDVVPVSELRDRAFGEKFGVRIAEGPLAGLLARSVVVIDENGKIIYSKLVEELTKEPEYEEVLGILSKADVKIDEDPQVCTHSNTAEHSRTSHIDEPCDDGSAG